MSVSEYWIGKDVDYRAIWRDYDDGRSYIDKFHSLRTHLICIEFEQFPADQPIFNHEAVYKTLKGYFHDLKKACLSSNEYDAAGPLFLYSVGRGSGIWSFLGELRQLIMFGTTLADEKMIGQKIENMDRRVMFLRKHFSGNVNPDDFQRFMRARGPRELEAALQKLFVQGFRRVQISQEPFDGNFQHTSETLVDIRSLLEEADGG